MDLQKIDLVNNWKFQLGDVPEAWSKTYPDNEWNFVTIPHDWSVKQPFSMEYSSGTGYVAGGIGWYRCSFLLDEKYRGQKISIVFDGVYKNSQVWCNSYYQGIWPYGYTTFRYDITDQVCYGDEENLISVKVSHTDIADSRWFTGSGITRKVYLLIEDVVHPVADGIFFQTQNVSTESAQIHISNEIVNDSDSSKIVTVKNVIMNNENNEMVSIESNCTLFSRESCVVENSTKLLMPDLWTPDNPTLYTLKTYLHYTEDSDSQNYDSQNYQSQNKEWYLADSRKVGIRSIDFNSQTGFYLNGISTKIKGVCLHHDAGCLGAAVLPIVWIRRLAKLKKMGCNAIRMSHNPHMPELYDLCDSLGFLVMDEAFDEWEGVKNKWSTGHNVYPPKHQGYYENFPEWHEKDLISLIRRDRNHPSIILWSIGNEIDYPNDPYCHPLFQTMTGNNDKNKPEAERQYNPDRPNAKRLSVVAADLTKIVKSEDTSRPVTLASAFPELSSQIGLFDTLDVIGYNYKEHLYQEDHNRFPNQPILGSENGHGYKEWLSVIDNDYISGQFLWTGIDYLGEAHGWPIHGSGAGLLTLAGFEKTSYYRRQSLWSLEPCLHLVSVRSNENNNEWTSMYESWNYVSGEQIEVRCYTNLKQAELFCNRESFGEKEVDKETGYISWQLPFEEGQIKAVAHLKDSNITIEDTLTTTMAACQIQLTDSDLSSFVIPEATLQKQNLHQIEVTVTDQNSLRVANDSSMLTVTIEENGQLLGLENGDLADITTYIASYRRAYEGRLLIYVRKNSTNLPTKLSVTGPNLKIGYITI